MLYTYETSFVPGALRMAVDARSPYGDPPFTPEVTARQPGLARHAVLAASRLEYQPQPPAAHPLEYPLWTVHAVHTGGGAEGGSNLGR